MPRCSVACLDFRIIPAGFNAPPEFLTGFTTSVFPLLPREVSALFVFLDLFQKASVPSVFRDLFPVV